MLLVFSQISHCFDIWVGIHKMVIIDYPIP